MKHTLCFVFLFLVCTHISAKVLIISDSHGTGAFGEELARLIETKNENVSFYAFGGTKPVDWIEGNNLTWGFWEHHTGSLDKRGDNRNTPKLKELLPVHKPSTVIIVQGTNMVWREQTQKDADQVQLLIKSVTTSGAKCIWVGQPDLNVPTVNQEKWVIDVQEMIEKETTVGGCQYIKSWTFTDYPAGKGDGIHYDQIAIIGRQLAKDWARGVFGKLNL